MARPCLDLKGVGGGGGWVALRMMFFERHHPQVVHPRFFLI